MPARRRRAGGWRSIGGALRRAGRRVVKPRVAALLYAAAGVVRLFGWLYVAVLVPAVLAVGYLVVRDAVHGGEIAPSLQLFPLVMIWPVAAIALRSDETLALRFPLNAVVLVGSVAFVIIGWSVVVGFVRGLLRARGSR